MVAVFLLRAATKKAAKSAVDGKASGGTLQACWYDMSRHQLQPAAILESATNVRGECRSR